MLTQVAKLLFLELVLNFIQLILLIELLLKVTSCLAQSTNC